MKVADGNLDFDSAFRAAKSAELQVMMTVSHSGGSELSNAAGYMGNWLNNRNIDYIVPQMYSGDYIGNFESAASRSVPWSSWRSAVPTVVPAVPSISDCSAASNFLQQQGISSSGCIQWQ